MSKIQQIINHLKPKGRPGRLPKITPCPYCGAHLNQTQHGKHRGACADQFRDAPPQPGRNGPPQPAEFSQDPGGGYNQDGTFPQT